MRRKLAVSEPMVTTSRGRAPTRQAVWLGQELALRLTRIYPLRWRSPGGMRAPLAIFTGLLQVLREEGGCITVSSIKVAARQGFHTQERWHRACRAIIRGEKPGARVLCRKATELITGSGRPIRVHPPNPQLTGGYDEASNDDVFL